VATASPAGAAKADAETSAEEKGGAESGRVQREEAVRREKAWITANARTRASGTRYPIHATMGLRGRVAPEKKTNAQRRAETQKNMKS